MNNVIIKEKNVIENLIYEVRLKQVMLDTEEEYTSLRFQSGTLKNGRGQHKKYFPYVFTEQGVAMLATVLRISISIMRGSESCGE